MKSANGVDCTKEDGANVCTPNEFARETKEPVLQSRLLQPIVTYANVETYTCDINKNTPGKVCKF